MNSETFRDLSAPSAPDLWLCSASACEHVLYDFCSFNLWPCNGPEHDLPHCALCAREAGALSLLLCIGSAAVGFLGVSDPARCPLPEVCCCP